MYEQKSQDSNTRITICCRISAWHAAWYADTGEVG